MTGFTILKVDKYGKQVKGKELFYYLLLFFIV